MDAMTGLSPKELTSYRNVQKQKDKEMNKMLKRNNHSFIESKVHIFDYYFMKVSDEPVKFNRVMPLRKEK
jgi:hypothetical protein